MSTSFADRFTTYAAQATISAGVQSVVYGQPLSETLQTGLITALTQSLTAEVGDWALENGIANASAAKILAHAVVQCASASLNRQDCGAAALGGAVTEGLSPVADQVGRWDKVVVALGAMLAARLAGEDTLTAAHAAQTVDGFNRRLHIQGIDTLRAAAREKANQAAAGSNQTPGGRTNRAIHRPD